MLRHALAAVVTPLALLALTGCGTQAAANTQAAKDNAFTVPAGVQEQYQVLADELAEKGKTVESGEWTVNLITEAAEPWFDEHGTHFRAPEAGETHHIEIIPVEASTGRIVPDVPITLEVVDAQDKVVQSMELNFYYSTFYHYANNFTVPEAGTYTVRATLGVPAFNRHGEESDTPPLIEGTTVEFKDVELS
ncbi:iron transporter [Pseudarthrobacter oxydans]|uniref:iron transporter n=1 Tax=Pseudarthrobacter oxydans TaxID=1671 RepID=UPI002AA6576C|nr:iron transporter [Pseudarthrobacter oxydans]WPU08609.1 iron transporter [Pseudarthrobacter oxydans]